MIIDDAKKLLRINSVGTKLFRSSNREFFKLVDNSPHDFKNINHIEIVSAQYGSKCFCVIHTNKVRKTFSCSSLKLSKDAYINKNAKEALRQSDFIAFHKSRKIKVGYEIDHVIPLSTHIFNWMSENDLCFYDISKQVLSVDGSRNELKESVIKTSWLSYMKYKRVQVITKEHHKEKTRNEKAK